MEQDRTCPSCEEPVIDKQPPCPLSCMSPKCKAYQKERKINVHHKPIIWVVGGPGCGKGTQCKKIITQYGYTHISPGDLLRAEAVSGSDRAKCLINVLTRGGLVPTDIVMNLIKDAMMKHLSMSKGYLVDGFPRTKDQGPAFEHSIASPTAIIYFEVSPETLLKRLMGQLGKGGRIDDNEETFKLRIQTFLFHNKEIITQYGPKVHVINAEGPVDAVFAQVQKVINPIYDKARAALTSAGAVPKLPSSIELP